MNPQGDRGRLRMLPFREYRGVNAADPLRFYYWPILGAFYRRRVEMCLSQCRGGSRVLEIGFGSGLSFLNLKEGYQEIHGVDLTVRAREVAEVFRPHGITPALLQGSVLQLPYKTGAFDTVLLISILEHLQPAEQDLAFSEITRVLRQGGEVIVGVPVERGVMRLLFRLMGVNIRQHHFSTDREVLASARRHLAERQLESLSAPALGDLYLVGAFVKTA